MEINIIKYFEKQFILKKFLQSRSFQLFSIKKKSHLLVAINFILSIFVFEIAYADINNFKKTNNNQLQVEYLDSRNELEDYIIDSGDELFIDFYPVGEFTNTYRVSAEGEIFLPRLEETYVRGLTTSEVQKLLEKRYSQFLIEPVVKVRIKRFKRLRVLVRGAVRNPGFYIFPAYQSSLLPNLQNDSEINQSQKTFDEGELESSSQSSDNSFSIKRTGQNITTISDVILSAGGITSFTDLSKIEILRDVPLSKGGGKKRAIINLNSFLNEYDDSNDLRIFDGDSIFIPELSQSSANQIPKSILSGLSPKFITVDIFGRVENPGPVKLPLEASLSDAIDLTGPIKPLSGKIVLIRYNKDGTVLKKNISYSARAKKGSKANPYIKEGDIISVKNSLIGKTTGFIREITSPFVGIYSTKQLIETF